MELKNPPQVGCVTCHHGVKRPETLAAALTRAAEKGGVDAAIENYRKLRGQYYGSAAYDFSPVALNQVAGELAESRKDDPGAIKLLQLNLEHAPKDADTYATLGSVQMASGDKAAAMTSLEKALEIDPNHRWAKMQIERAKGGQ
jgi:tetratricopeptide (TPR) repeat protein